MQSSGVGGEYIMRLPAHKSISKGIPQKAADVFGVVSCELEQVRGLINEQLVGSCRSESVRGLVEGFDICGGKMLRPGLLLVCGKAVGELTDEHIRAAAVVEMIHNATLLHDDVIDEGQRRRGGPTANNLWGNETAVLLGDFLFSRACEMCADMGGEVNKVLLAATARVCEGELRQVVERENRELGESEYLEIISDKSGSLFGSSCYLGGFLAGSGEREAELLRSFGLNVGIAFQIMDDLVDIIGDERRAGKTLGSDVDKNKLTLAVIHLLGQLDDDKRAVVKGSLEAGGGSKESLIEMLVSYGSVGYAKSRAQEFVDKAILSLDGLRAGIARGALIEAARFVCERTI